MKKIIIGNWKMNPITLDEAKRIHKSVISTAAKLKSMNVVVCPPYVYIPALTGSKSATKVTVGAQNAYSEEQGSYTGEVSAKSLKDLGCTHVIIGHSERRAMGETDEAISKKVQIVLDSGLIPVLCVGEKERNDHGEHLDFLRNQIKASLNKVAKKGISKLIVAYEPVWAIGAKEPMDPGTIYEMNLFVKKVLSDIYGQSEAAGIPILYGGSVNFKNAGEIILKGKVDGLLVGRESVNAIGFAELLKTIDSL
jgi:triosephosphate isomerase